jgi:tRNA-dependent cyclodipeptide synthase
MTDATPTILTKVSFRCKKELKDQLKGSDCIVYISVGQPYHESEKFIATMDLVNRTFKSVMIVVCDTLQRHTLQIQNPTLSEEDAHREAFLQGQAWLKRNRFAYENLSIDYEITRWDNWLHKTDYLNYLDEVQHLYHTNVAYQKAIRTTIHKYLGRQGIADNQRSFDLCEKYILEECPILVPLWAKTGVEFVIYPHERTPAMALTYDFFVSDRQESHLQQVALKFSRRTIPVGLSFKNQEQNMATDRVAC